MGAVVLLQAMNVLFQVWPITVDPVIDRLVAD